MGWLKTQPKDLTKEKLNAAVHCCEETQVQVYTATVISEHALPSHSPVHFLGGDVLCFWGFVAF